MKKIKILFAINNLNLGGAEFLVAEQFNGIDRNVFDPRLATLYKNKEPNLLYRIDSLYHKDFAFKKKHLISFCQWYSVYRYLVDNKFDVVYSHLFESNIIFRICAYFAGVKVIMSFEHSQYYNKNKFQLVIDKILSLITDKIIVSTDSVLQFTSKQEKIPINKFYLITNPVILPEKIKNRQEFLKTYKINGDNRFIVLTLGRFSDEKNLFFLIESAKILKQQYPNLLFLLVGYGPLKNALMEKISELDLNDYCLVIEDPLGAKNFYSISDIFVLPSIREGQSIVVYEAMMAGLPVIASNISGPSDIISNSIDGFLFDNTKVMELVDRIKKLYLDDRLRIDFSLRARKKVEMFDISYNVLELQKVILQILDQNKKWKKNCIIKLDYKLPGFFSNKRWYWFVDPSINLVGDLVNCFSFNDVNVVGFKKKTRLTTLIDLSRDLSDILLSMRQKFIVKQIKRGEINGIKIKQDNNFSGFKKIYYTFRKNKNIRGDRFSIFKNNGIEFSAYYKGKMIAGGIFIFNDTYARAWVLASLRLNLVDNRMKELIGQANRLVIWEAIRFFKNYGVKYLDLGGIDPDSSDAFERSLAEFKEAFGGDRINCFFYIKKNFFK